eukprot:GHVU01124053.1.p1 GENE.GHVU01124053.1~~GHVU01124053.1.p1  ORF type:complete len:242 (-),score=20.44 GHVU01124053.1:202-927(-)
MSDRRTQVEPEVGNVISDLLLFSVTEAVRERVPARTWIVTQLLENHIDLVTRIFPSNELARIGLDAATADANNLPLQYDPLPMPTSNTPPTTASDSNPSETSNLAPTDPTTQSNHFYSPQTIQLAPALTNFVPPPAPFPVPSSYRPRRSNRPHPLDQPLDALTRPRNFRSAPYDHDAPRATRDFRQQQTRQGPRHEYPNREPREGEPLIDLYIPRQCPIGELPQTFNFPAEGQALWQITRA